MTKQHKKTEMLVVAVMTYFESSLYSDFCIRERLNLGTLYQLFIWG